MKNEHKILHAKFVRYGTNAKEWMRKCVLLLPEIARHRIWEQKGFGSIYEYAAKIAGMSRATVDDALRILRRIEDKPALQKVVEQKGINAVRPVVRVATIETEQFWAKKASSMSKHTLETYVRDLQRQEISRTGTGNTTQNPQQQAIGNFVPLSHESASNTTLSSSQAPTDSIPPRKLVAMQLEPEVAAQLEKLMGSGDWNDLMKELLELRKQKLESEKPAPVETESRHIPVKIKQYVLNRTNGTCSFPGCTKPHKILHHTQRFGLEKIHDPDKLEPLCKAHERLAHLSLIENEDAAAETWRLSEQPNFHNPKFEIDAVVSKFRAPAA